MSEANVFRGIFFAMTFFTIGALSNIRALWAEGVGRLALVYVLSRFGFIVWLGLLVSWLFFHGVQPPLTTGESRNGKDGAMNDERRIADEFRQMPEEVLLPVENRLIAGSLRIGLVLLGG